MKEIFTKITDKISDLKQNEIIIMSISSAIIVSIILGNLFLNNTYYRLSSKQGQAIEVSKRLSTYSIGSFNYSLAIVSFLIVSILIYFLFKKSNEH